MVEGVRNAGQFVFFPGWTIVKTQILPIRDTTDTDVERTVVGSGPCRPGADVSETTSTTKVEPMEPYDDDALLTPSEVAAMFRVNPKTVTRWARAGKISAIRTLGGQRRFRASEIRQFLEQVEDSDRI